MHDKITIVSGLPRSGTSMMMRMLEAGGIEILTDNIRKADIDNPKGYFELEKAKKIKEESGWLNEARGKAFKMVSMLLYDLPNGHKYNIVFMKRNMDEIIRSQEKMLERKWLDQSGFESEKLIGIYEKHLQHVEAWLRAQENIDVIYLTYNNLLESPEENMGKVIHFLARRLDLAEMIAVVDKNLYRNREKNGGNRS